LSKICKDDFRVTVEGLGMNWNDRNRIKSTKPMKAGARILGRDLSESLAAMCENNFGHAERPKVKRVARIWYYLDARLNASDRQISIPPRLFGRN
jgi:hypothetical protein